MARKPRPVVIDFETEEILDRPNYPPKPVGVSILMPGEKKPKYWAFGHPTENNCTEAQAKRAYGQAYQAGKQVGMLCHHGKFDHDVAETHWGFELLPWELMHETMFLLFLNDPYSPDLQLKPASERLLSMPPDESDALRDWCIANKLIPKNAKEYGHLISKIPGALVGTYACGDVTRTVKLFDKLWTRIQERGMLPAYEREQQLMPVLLRNEREGIYADKKLLAADEVKYSAAMGVAETWVRKRLKDRELNLDAPAKVLDAMLRCRVVDEKALLRTPGGSYSASKDSLLGAVTDKKLLQVLQYQSKLSTALKTFIRPWSRQATETGGTVHPSWNQVRTQGTGGDDAGAKTGRLSAARFLNAPKRFEESDKFIHPRFAGIVVPELPMVRSYLQPDPGQIWLKRDYAAQELRVLAHFEDGVLLQSYLDNPSMDIHQMAGDLLIGQFGLFDGDRKKARSAAKTIGFGLLYGMGLAKLADKLGVEVQDAKIIKAAYLQIFPGLESLQAELNALGRGGDFMRTWGGRQYYAEEPKFIPARGRVCTFEYRLMNYLIQGSAADCTKLAVIRYDEARKFGRFLIAIHDEINLSCLAKHAKSEMALLREVMASIEFDVPMLSDGAVGKAWGSLESFKEAA